MKPKATRSGFTLIELLVVIAIIAIIAGMLWPRGEPCHRISGNQFIMNPVQPD